MSDLGEIIGQELARWPVCAVEMAVFGTKDPSRIADLTASFCRYELGIRASSGLFYRASAGVVIGVVLESGTRVVVKAYQPRWTTSFLGAVQDVQRHLAIRGFPCPVPLLEARPIADGSDCLATVDSWLPDPGLRAYADRTARRISAAGLARQIELSRGLHDLEGLDGHPLGQSADSLYPEPHSPLFDFEATADGAHWIDDLARRGSGLRDADRSRRSVAHLDWSARNVRLDDHQVVAVYDWDSVGLTPESTAVGQAAATWSVTSEPGGSIFPSAEDVAGFVADYEEAAGRALSATQWQAVGGAVVWLLAYTARCEHSLEARGRARSDQTGARDRLRREGEQLLRLGH